MLQRLLREDRFEDYYREILEKASRPHMNIDQVIDPLRELVFRYNPIEITVSTRRGVMGNACWVEYRDRTRYFTYHHDSHELIIRRDSKQGEIIARVTNDTNLTREVEPLLRD